MHVDELNTTSRNPPKMPKSFVIRDLDMLLGDGRTIVQGTLTIIDGIIHGVANNGAAIPSITGLSSYSGRNFIAIPGLINAHTHAPMSFFRGFGHGRDSMIESFLFPAEKALSPDLIEPLSWPYLFGSLLSGVTCIADHYYFVAGVGHALEKLGMRGVLGETVADLGGAFPDLAAEERAARQIENWKFSPRITPCVAPHAADTVSPALMDRLVAIARHHGLPVHLHLSQTAGERDRVIRREGISPVKYADRHGALGENTLTVHLVSADSEDIKILRDRGVTIGYCPGSELIYEGLPPIEMFRRHGIPVAVATDCAASNDGADLLSELRLAQFIDLERNRHFAESALDQALSQVTSIPAKVLGLSTTCGALAPGLAADIVFLEKGVDVQPTTQLTPVFHYSMGSQHVRHVMIEGEWILWNRQPVRVSLADMMKAFSDANGKIRSRTTSFLS